MNPMGWWRRNWVDTLMITLILLVVGGFVSLLLRGTPGLNATNNTQNTPTSIASGQNITTSNPSSVPAEASTTTTSEASTSSPNAVSGKPATVPTTKPSNSKPGGSSSITKGNKVTSTEMTRVEPSSITAGTSTAATSSDSKSPVGESKTVSANSLNAQSKADSPQLDSSEPAQATGSRELTATGNATVTLSKAPPKPALPKVSTIVETPVAPKTVIQAPAPRPAVVASKPLAKPEVVGKAVTSSPSRSVYLRSYRVAVGSFSDPSRAESLASSLRSEGLPARAIRSGGTTVVIVGPYKTQNEAQAAFDQVKTAHSDAILFKPNGVKVRANAGTQAATTSSDSSSETTPTQTASEATSSTPAQSSDDASISSPETPQAAPEPTQAKPAPLGRYLQVGAFKDIASAGPVLAKLAKYGYRGTLDQGSDGLTRVLVGPYDTKTFERAKRNLRSRGFTVFAAK
jgi:cell division protein FtsN